MYLLDTNVVSELRKVRSGKADPGVAAWSDQVDAAELHISVITLHELEVGLLLVQRRDAAQGQVLRAWFEGHVLPAFAGRILPVSEPVVRRSAPLHVPDPPAAGRCNDRRDRSGPPPDRRHPQRCRFREHGGPGPQPLAGVLNNALKAAPRMGRRLG